MYEFVGNHHAAVGIRLLPVMASQCSMIGHIFTHIHLYSIPIALYIYVLPVLKGVMCYQMEVCNFTSLTHRMNL